MPVLGRLSSLVWLALARWFDAKGLGATAEQCLRNATGGLGGAAVDAGYRLGRRLLEQDKNADAATVLEQVLGLNPRHARAWCALGAARRRLADLDGCREATEAAIAIDPDYAQAHSNLGEWWLVKGEPLHALELVDHALVLEPGLLEAMNNRVAALYELGRLAEAAEAARQAIERHPTSPALQVNLGNVLLHSGRARPAVKAYRQALALDPACTEALLSLATLLGDTDQLADALAHIEHEIAVRGINVQRLVALALAQQANNDPVAAEATCHQVLERQPGNVAALVTLAGCLSARGDHKGAIQTCERALAANPNMPGVQSNIAFDANYVSDLSAEQVFAYHLDWATRFEVPAMSPCHPHPPCNDVGRRLRIGYVSGDFGMHPVGFLIRDVLRHHDSAAFEVHLFSMMRKDDDITKDIRSHADVWHDVLLDSDEELAQTIREAGIDILVDLSGHTAYNRLVTFALRPAPIQATWIGYFHSTGLRGIDYFLADPYTSPMGCDQLFSEVPVYLPHSRFCYSPPAYASLPAPVPLLANGRVTFGSFNRLEKLVDPVIEVWAEILRAVPGSTLLLKSGSLDSSKAVDDLHRRFAVRGIAPDRLLLRGRSSHAAMLEEYADMDIALDPFPFNGGMTTLEALWMGVPVVTLAGTSVVSRQSLAVLENMGVPELIFPDLASYVAGAVALANDRDRLVRLRRELRPRLAASPICQPEQFTRDLEALYRRMWRAWCAGTRLPSDVAVPGASGA